MGWKTRRRASDGRGRNLQEVSEFEYFDYTGFVKVAQRPDAFYGKLYRDRKAYETAKNEAGHYAEQAAATLKNKRIGTGTEAYKTYAQGKLPPALLHARAKRYTVKMFLAHLHDSELTSCSRNTNYQAALQAFAIFTFTLCSTWFVMTRNRSACCS